MVISDISLASSIIAIAGGISILALMVSKLCLFFIKDDDKKKIDHKSTYECGFNGLITPKFRYVSDQSFKISLFLVMELAISWLLICFVYQITAKDWNGLRIIKILTGVILISLLIVSRALKK